MADINLEIDYQSSSCNFESFKHLTFHDSRYSSNSVDVNQRLMHDMHHDSPSPDRCDEDRTQKTLTTTSVGRRSKQQMAYETADMDACLRQVKKLSDRYERLSQCAGMY